MSNHSSRRSPLTHIMTTEQQQITMNQSHSPTKTHTKHTQEEKPADVPMVIVDGENDRGRRSAHDLHASINTTRSAVDSSYTSIGSRNTSLDDTYCNETLDEYPEVSARAIASASQNALDRVHIQSLQAQVDAARIWNTSLEEENERLRRERDEWRTLAGQREDALRHNQIILSCLQQEQTKPPAAASSSHRTPISPRTAAFDRERQSLQAHHKAAIEAKDSLITSLAAERERAELALRQARAELAEQIRHAGETRYADAVLAYEQREKFQHVVESQLNQQRLTIQAASMKMDQHPATDLSTQMQQ